ncbi:peptidoglycan-binding domain-containing protein [Streptomyces sp. NPDC005648]|uniref:peptidoglycan-binding domain-containing protein n=1 Tax=Streptomyces sp. NPDC005648 TaxID=3157044 RepID=UPI0033B680AE
MTDRNGHLCPECGAPRGADNTPSCGCTRRAAEALRETRTAEAAAAEDFDPLRIRPYVELEGSAEGVLEGAADETMPLRAVPGHLGATPAIDDDLPTRELRLSEASMGPAALEALEAHDGAGASRPSRRRRGTVLLGAGGALVAVVAAAGLASGMFSYQTPTRNTALPHDVRASVPDASTSPASPSPSLAATSPLPAAPPPSVRPHPSLPPSPSASGPAPSPSRSTAPTTAPPTATATGTVTAGQDRQSQPPVLRRGDSGPEVTELELRLTQLGLYTRQASGQYNEGVEDAVTRYQQARGLQVPELGVYDLETRAHLESETTQP